MLRIVLPMFILILSVLFLSGCFNLQVDEPLVDLGGDEEYQSEKVRDPAPGVPDSKLNREQLLQRELAKCQYLRDIAEKKKKKIAWKIRLKIWKTKTKTYSRKIASCEKSFGANLPHLNIGIRHEIRDNLLRFFGVAFIFIENRPDRRL